MMIQALVVLCLVPVMVGCTSPGSVEELTARTTSASTATPVSVTEPISGETSAVESLMQLVNDPFSTPPTYSQSTELLAFEVSIPEDKAFRTAHERYDVINVISCADADGNGKLDSLGGIDDPFGGQSDPRDVAAQYFNWDLETRTLLIVSPLPPPALETDCSVDDLAVTIWEVLENGQLSSIFSRGIDVTD